MAGRLKIFVYCQHVWGLGHFFRIREIIRALDAHDVVLVTGGPQVGMPLPPHVRRYQLPALRMQADKTLIAENGLDEDEVWLERVNRLDALFRREAPDVFLVELYPLGRKKFRRELDPILAGVRLGRLPACRVYCSVRDILVAKPDPAAYEARVCRDLNRWFDALLVHADPTLVTLDETFGAVADIKIPVVYTGFVARPGAGRTRREIFRQQLGIGAGDTLIVVSAGGGRSGFPLLSAVLAAVPRLKKKIRLRMAVFTGPYLPDDQQVRLPSAPGPEVTLHQFSPEFENWLGAADLSVSMAGYNTCMNLLTAEVPALVLPYEGDREQPLRAARLAETGWLSVLSQADLDPPRLAARIAEALSRTRRPTARLDLEGARQTADYIRRDHQVQKAAPRKTPVLKIVVYCQHLLGIGHFFRTLEICRALEGHDIMLVTGGQELPAPLPDHVRHRKLPELVTDPDFRNLHSPGGEALAAIRDERRRRLRAILREEAPDVFLIELYPVGRKAFRFELDPLLAEIAEGRLPPCKVLCSVRDILVEKEDTRRHETRAADVLNRWFDALLVHADPNVVRLETTFNHLDAIRIPIVYTGFVAPAPAPPLDREHWRKARGIAPDQRLVVVSAGGGAVGYPLLAAAARAVAHLPADLPIRMQIFTGPYLSDEERRRLQQECDPRLQIDAFAAEFPVWLQAADLSLSMAGYNTCMTILSTGVRALVFPFTQNREQGLRARLLAERGLLAFLTESDLHPPVLAERIQQELQAPGRPGPVAIDLDGAPAAARWIEGCVPGEKSVL